MSQNTNKSVYIVYINYINIKNEQVLIFWIQEMNILDYEFWRDDQKNQKLIKERWISFEEIRECIYNGWVNIPIQLKLGAFLI